MARKGGLGRGFDALMMDNSSGEEVSIELNINEIEPNADQPRRRFDEQALEELCENIKQYGLLQPIVVRPNIGGGYQIVAGERRWRASRMAGLKTVPVVIKELTDAEAMEIALIENLQREDLNPIEEAEGYRKLMDSFDLTQEEVAEKMAKSRSAIANALRLLDLGDFKKYVESGEISAGHARAMIPLDDTRRIVAVSMVKKGATVRDIERYVKNYKSELGGENVRKKREFGKDAFLKQVELSLCEALGRKVTVSRVSPDKGELKIAFYSEEDLKDIISKMFGNM